MTKSELDRKSLEHQLKTAKVHLRANESTLLRLVEPYVSPFPERIQLQVETLEEKIADLKDEVWAIEEDIKEL